MKQKNKTIRDINVYLNYTVRSYSIDEISQKAGISQRQIKYIISKIEALRDQLEWDEVLSKLEKYYLEENIKNISATTGLRLLTGCPSISRLLSKLHTLKCTSLERVFVVTSCLDDNVAIIKEGVRLDCLSRKFILGMIFMGWLSPFGERIGEFQKFTIKKSSNLVLQDYLDDNIYAKPATKYITSNTLRRIPEDVIETAISILPLWHCGKNHQTPPILARQFPSTMIDVFEGVFIRGERLQELERNLCISARSGKEILALAVDCFAISLGVKRPS